MISRISTLFLLIFLSACQHQKPVPIIYKYEYDGGSKKKTDKIIERAQNPDKINITDDRKISKIRKNIVLHQVVEGETVESVASKYAITESSLVEMNRLQKPYKLVNKQILTIPANAEENKPKKDAEAALEQSSDVIISKKVALFLPTDGKITSYYGDLKFDKKNDGVNISAKLGAPVYSKSDGEIVFAGQDSKFGNLVLVKSDNIFMSYAHMDDMTVKKGDRVRLNQLIGHVGKTGDVKIPQLHFAVRKGKASIDPIKYLRENLHSNT